MNFLVLKVPRGNEYSYEQALAVFASLAGGKSRGVLSKILQRAPAAHYSFNIISLNQTIHFAAGTAAGNIEGLKNQLLAQYSKADLIEMEDFLELGEINYNTVDFAELTIPKSPYLPLKTIDTFTDVDPLASVLSAMGRSAHGGSIFWLQIIVSPITSKWQSGAKGRIGHLTSLETPTQASQAETALIQEKLKYHNFTVNIRLVTNNKAQTQLLADAFTVFSHAVGTSLRLKKAGHFHESKLREAIKNHSPYGTNVFLNSLELTGLWHLPKGSLDVPNIAWGRRLQMEPPENLPIASEGMTKEQKADLTFIGKTVFKNRQHVFGIKAKDRLRHVYIVGKTGTGKSWLIDNMAIEDIRKGAGVAVLDPHGDAIDNILQYIPKNRINDVCYFNPADTEYSYPLNILEIDNPSQKELMVSGIIAIFYKLYAHSWGPRLEHILRNVLFTLTYVDGATLPDVLKILHDKKYRNNVLAKINDPVVLQFWKKEFDSMSENFASEAISPILNKVGQFVTSPLVRKVIQHPKSKVKIQEMMDHKKIFLCDLSQGKLGEDNAALLGSMIITKIQIAAMNRAFQKEEDRVPFYLYVDEFQNFATQSFSKILSEARKYRLGLTLANQYITQIDEEVMGAILGNVGTLTTFSVGARDAEILHKEFGSQMEPEDITTLDKYQMLTRLAIDNRASDSFTCYSLPLPKNISGHQEKIIEQSRKRYGVKTR